MNLSGAGPRDFGARDPLPARTLGHGRWPDDPRSIATGDRRPLRTGTAPLRADAIPSGAINDASVADFVTFDGIAISKRQLVRLLNEKHEGFIAEAQNVLRAGLETSPWVSVDDTGARHAGKNGFCTQIGNEWFTWFRTRSSKSRLNFLDLLRAGYTDYVLNDAAYDYMRNQGLPAATIARLKAEPETRFGDQTAWKAHLDRLGFNALKVTPEPVRVVTRARCGAAFRRTNSSAMPSC